MPARKKLAKNVKKLEKDIKEEKSLWKKIQQIHKKDQGFLASIKGIFRKKPSKQKNNRK